MSGSSKTRFETFRALHVPGNPLILYNIWDVASARAVARSGARAIATGSDPVAEANGYRDGEEVPIDFALANAARIVAAVELPVTIDFESGYAMEPQQVARNVARLAATGAVGCNFEDQAIGGEGLHATSLHARRIAAARLAVGEGFFINARTDLFLKSGSHDLALVDQVVERGKAYADAGASGIFVPFLSDPNHVERVARHVPLPLNLLAFPGAPPNSDWARAGAARISHGPFPQRSLMRQLEEAARAALA